MDEPQESGKKKWGKQALPWLAGLAVVLLVLVLAGPILPPGLGPLRMPLPSVDTAQPGTPEAIAAAVTPSVVGIVSKSIVEDWWGNRSQTMEASGTGVIFDPRGFIFTNNHVVEGAKELLVSLADGRKVSAKLVGADPVTDLAVIKVNVAQDLPAATLGNSDTLRPGQLAVAIGNPMGMEFQGTVTAGVISGLNRVLQVGERLFRLIQTDATINPGNSGGPLLNSRGEVIGINAIKIAMPKVEGMGFAIPINTAQPIIAQLVSKGKISRPWLGLSLVTKAEAADYGIDFAQGLLVIKVIPGSPAADAKISEGDLLTELEGQKTNTFDDIHRVLDAKKVGDLVTLTLMTSDGQKKVQVRLGEMPGETS